jgi:gluconolactonase
LIDIRSEKIRQLVDENVEIRQLGAGYGWVEGPIWVQEGDFLLFSDILHDARRRWDFSGVRTVITPTLFGNGMTLDAEGRLLVCEGRTGTISRMQANGVGGGREIVASHYEGKRLNSPNDIVVAEDGSVWFTDPGEGSRPTIVDGEREPELDFQGVFRLAASGEVDLQVRDFVLPNGLCFSPDEALLYVNDTFRSHIRVFEVGSDGSLSNDRVFADEIAVMEDGSPRFDLGVVDGMKCDEHGNIWVTGPAGIWIFSPAGEHLGVVRLPEQTANLHWGGPDWNWLFVTASTGVYWLKTKVSGRPEAFMTR